MFPVLPLSAGNQIIGLQWRNSLTVFRGNRYSGSEVEVGRLTEGDTVVTVLEDGQKLGNLILDDS